MPTASDWECCNCHNVWSYAIYASCVSCHHRNCPRCTPLVISPRPKPKPRHSQKATATRSPLDSSHTVPITNIQTSLYTCCKCHDGPKVWEHQRRCVSCDHTACRDC